MHTVKLKVGDSIYAHLMFFLKNLKTDELQIVEDSKTATPEDAELKSLMELSNSTLCEIWDNKEDDIYDKYL